VSESVRASLPSPISLSPPDLCPVLLPRLDYLGSLSNIHTIHYYISF
jgi:hypothetical protein